MLFVLLSFISGCYIDKECLCTDIYDPVCGANNKSYGNPCEAECDNVKYIKGECPVSGIGQVVFSGDSTCGFLVNILGQSYKPDTILPQFRIEGLNVSLYYRRLMDFESCFYPVEEFQVIHILEMEKFINN